jgi:hypothetical protein
MNPIDLTREALLANAYGRLTVADQAYAVPLSFDLVMRTRMWFSVTPATLQVLSVAPETAVQSPGTLAVDAADTALLLEEHLYH